MINIEVNKQAPKELLEMFLKAPQIERVFCSTQNGGFDVYLILDGISKKELEEIKGDLSVIYHDLEIPILVLKYKNDSYEMALHTHVPTGNAMRILVVDLKGYIVKHYRLLGLDDKIFNAIKTGVELIKEKKSNEILRILEDVIFVKYTSNDLLRGGVRQRFSK